MTTAETMMDARDRIEDAGESLQDLLDEYTNVLGTDMDAGGDVWDGRGYWWTDEHKAKFVDWLRSRIDWE